MKSLLGVNYYLSPADGDDSVFDVEHSTNQCSPFLHRFKTWIERRYNVEVHTPDVIDWNLEEAKAVLYFDYSWRYSRNDAFIDRIPFKKRALMMIEPANVNPSLYYISFYRNKFSKVFTWDRRLLRRNPDYFPVNVPVGAEPSMYRHVEQRIPFSQKKLLVAVSRNRWSYMANSTYGIRTKAYSFFDRRIPDDFDLYGYGWNAPSSRLQKLFGYPCFKCYRGPILGDHWNGKVAKMAGYKFALCYENNALQPGYISEKILDCFCARCVPIYYGSDGIEDMIPCACWINAKEFPSLETMLSFITNMKEKEHNAILESIERFLNSSACDFFSTEHYFTSLAEGIGLERRA